MKLRPARTDDADAVRAVADAAYAHYPERMGGLRPAPLDADYGRAVSEHEVWVAVHDDDVVAAYVVLVDAGDRLVLENVAVQPSHQGRGLGGRLLQLAERRAVELGYDTIRLYTHVTMTENQAIYEHAGYERVEERPEGGFQRVFFEKDLRRGPIADN